MTTNTYVFLYKRALTRAVHSTVIPDRTNIGCRSVFDINLYTNTLETDTKNIYNFPILTLRKVSSRIAFEELMWMMRGSTDVTELQEKNIHIWDEHSSREFLDSRGLDYLPENSIGKAYGYQMRNFNGVDQLRKVYDGLKNDPYGRRHLVSFWNVGELEEMALEPCHFVYNFCVIDGTLNLKFIMRSNDAVLGQPTNIMFASFWLIFFARALGLKAGVVACSVTNWHIYQNTLEAAEIMAEREPYVCPRISVKKDLNSLEDILNLKWEDIQIESYTHHDPIDKSKLIIAV